MIIEVLAPQAQKAANFCIFTEGLNWVLIMNLPVHRFDIVVTTKAQP